MPGCAETGRDGCSRRCLALGSVRDICYSQDPDGTKTSARPILARYVAKKFLPSVGLWLIWGQARCLGRSSSRPRGWDRVPLHNYHLGYPLVALGEVLEKRTRDQVVLGDPYRVCATSVGRGSVTLVVREKGCRQRRGFPAILLIEVAVAIELFVLVLVFVPTFLWFMAISSSFFLRGSVFGRRGRIVQVRLLRQRRERCEGWDHLPDVGSDRVNLILA